MPTSRELARPPIVEALVDIRIAPIDATPDLFAKFIETLASDYPHVEKQNFAKATLRVEDGRIVGPESQDVGFSRVVLRNAGKTRIVQFRADGFTFSQLAPYEGGNSLIQESLRLWRGYAEACGADDAIRTALRYVNHLVLPWRAGDNFSRFLRATAELPPEVPQRVSSFALRTVLHDRSAGIDAIVIQRLEPTAQEHTSKPLVVLDFDVFVPTTLASSEIPQVMEALREMKNRLFFAYLSEEALKEFE